MQDPISLVALSAFALAALGLSSAALLKAWHGWLELKRLELGGGTSGNSRSPARTELKTLRERVRRLEAIASGEA